MTVFEWIDALVLFALRAEEANAQGMSNTEEQWKQKLSDVESKLRKKIQESNVESERAQVEMKNSFQAEKDAMQMRITSLEKQRIDDIEDKDHEIKELNDALDEMDAQSAAEMDALKSEPRSNKSWPYLVPNVGPDALLCCLCRGDRKDSCGKREGLHVEEGPVRGAD